MSDNVTKIILGCINALGSVAIVGIVATIFVGQWWITPKHKAKAIEMIVNKYKASGKIDEDGNMTKEDAESLKKDLESVVGK